MAYYCLQGCKLACTEPCRACGKGCAMCFHACDASCSAITNLFCPRDRASPVFLIYTVGMNAVPAAFAVAAAASHWHNDCNKDLALWLLVTALVLNVFMIAFALRIHVQYNKPDALNQGRRPAHSIDRFLHIFWWEPLVAAYFVMCPAALVWSVLGLRWAGAAAVARHRGEIVHCSRALIHMTRASAVVMIVYIALSAAVSVLSCCCSCLSGAFATGDAENQRYAGYQQDGMPPTRPSSTLEPGASFISGLFHPRQQIEQWGPPPSAPPYQPLPGGNGNEPHDAPPQMRFDAPTAPLPPSGAQPQRNGAPVVPPLNLPPRKDM